MKKSLYYIALSALIFSGCNSLEIDKTSTGIIKIGKVSVLSSATKSDDGNVNTVFSSGEETIEETATPLSSHATKAEEKKAGSLSLFNILGYYDSDIVETVAGEKVDDLYFLKNTTAEKNGSAWSLNSDAKWAHDIDHYFWAYSGDASEFEANSDDFSKASFSYKSDGSDDLLVAYTKQHWNGQDSHSDDDCGSGDDIEKIEFRHALSELVANTSGYKFYIERPVEGGTTKVEDTDNRLKIEDVAFYVASEGTCEVDEASSFSWEPDSKSVASISLLNEENSAFVIPQDKDDVMVQVTILDTWRGNSWPAIYKFSGDESRPLGTWEPGTRYTYNINGSMTVPYIDTKPISGGIELNLAGNGFGDAVTGVIQGKYIRTLELSWIGLPHTNGKGTYLAIYVGNNPPNSLGESDYNNEGIAFFYDAKDLKVIQSPNMVSATLPTDISQHNNKDEAYLSAAKCSCVITLPSEDCKVYVLYKGSDNGGTGIALKEFNCEVKSFR